MTRSIIAASLKAANAGNGFAVYGGSSEPEGVKLARAYLAMRQRGETAADSLKAARGLVEGGGRLPWPARAGDIGAPGDGGARWIEEPASNGLRFVGFADDVTALRNRGYYMDSDGDGETARGCVYQLPARGGRPVYVAAVQTGSESKSKGWRATADNADEYAAGALFYLAGRGALHYGARGGTEGEHADAAGVTEAAHYADGRADRYAEEAREYSDTWRAGRDAADAIENADAERESARALMAELRGLAPLPGAVCAELRAAIGRKLRRARKLYAEAAELWRDNGTAPAWGADLSGAFRDGAGAATYWEARSND